MRHESYRPVPPVPVKRTRPTRTVYIAGQAYTVVWDGHRDGKTLLSYGDLGGRADHTIERGRLRSITKASE